MLKRILVFLLISLILGLTLYFANHYYLLNSNLVTDFSVKGIYLFFFTASLIVYILVELVSQYIPNQAGFAYLALMFIKIGIFLLIFKNVIFGDNPLEIHEKTSVILPFFLFLLLEGIIIGKLLNNK